MKKFIYYGAFVAIMVLSGLLSGCSVAVEERVYDPYPYYGGGYHGSSYYSGAVIIDGGHNRGGHKGGGHRGGRNHGSGGHDGGRK